VLNKWSVVQIKLWLEFSFELESKKVFHF